jgi:hypothetical protein
MQGPLEMILGEGEAVGVGVWRVPYYRDGDKDHHSTAIDLPHLIQLPFPTNLLHPNYQPTKLPSPNSEIKNEQINSSQS